jgi:hypothetical protein
MLQGLAWLKIEPEHRALYKKKRRVLYVLLFNFLLQLLFAKVVA